MEKTAFGGNRYDGHTLSDEVQNEREWMIYGKERRGGCWKHGMENETQLDQFG